MVFKQKKALIISDFDGTICKLDVGSEFLTRFAGKPRVELERLCNKECTGSRAAYQQIMPLIKGNREEMQKFALSKGKLTRGFLPFYRLCIKKDLDVKILSDGLDFYIRCILENKGITDIEFYSNVVEFGDEESMRIRFPEMNELCGRCGTCKNAILHSFRLRYEKILYIGDGHSDWCPSRCADVVFAKGILLKQYEKEGLPCIPFEDFNVIHQYLKRNF